MSWKSHLFQIVCLYFLAASAHCADVDLFMDPKSGEPKSGAASAFTARDKNDPILAGGKGRVRWRTWGAQAFAEAARDNKIILLFITANWCHAGKTMERVTFTDLQVATRLNEEFVPIRLDRDERPDIDLRMQHALQALAGARGWPVTLFLTPDGNVWQGGTYYTVETDMALERPGMRDLIQFAVQAWRTEHDAVLRHSREVEDALKKGGLGASTNSDPPAGILDSTAHKLQAALDLKAGGFAASLMVRTKGAAGHVPRSSAKFPAPRALELCLTHYSRTGDAKSLEVAVKTLDAMLKGGIYDQLGGGFHRYTSDRWWRLPNFEKLLALNAEMVPVCLHAWEVTKNERYKRAVLQTLGCWAAAPLSGTGTKENLFFASQAADVNGIDAGDYYTWSVKEFEKLLPDDKDLRVARLFWGVDESGEMVQTAPERNVLYEALSMDETAVRAGLSNADASARIERIRPILLEARAQRPAPVVDVHVCVDGNALMAAAFIECGHALGQNALLERGLRTLKLLLKEAIENDGPNLTHTRHILREERRAASTVALAEDEAALGYACAIAFEATSEPVFAQEAEASLRRMYLNFWDKGGEDGKDEKGEGGYFDRMIPALEAPNEPANSSDWKVKIWQDTWEPSANALVALTCVKMGKLTGRKEFYDRAKSIVAAFGGSLEKAGLYGAALDSAADAVEKR